MVKFTENFWVSYFLKIMLAHVAHIYIHIYKYIYIYIAHIAYIYIYIYGTQCVLIEVKTVKTLQ